MTAKESTPEGEGRELSREQLGSSTHAARTAIGIDSKNPDHQRQTHSFRSLELEQRYIDEPRKLRVVVVGAGLSGVIAGVLLPAKVPNLELTILEKNPDVVSVVPTYPETLKSHWS